MRFFREFAPKSLRVIGILFATMTVVSTTRLAFADQIASASPSPAPEILSSGAPPIEPVITAITVHHDGSSGRPTVDALPRFGVAGEPLAYIDWLCLQTDRDAGPAMQIALDDIGVLDQNGDSIGRFRSASGRNHSFTAAHYRDGSHARYRYCTHILPREWRVDTVRFVRDSNATYVLSRVQFSYRGDVQGCGEASTRHGCGSLHPAAGSFSFGAASLPFAHLDVSRAQTAEVDFRRGLVGGIAQLRITAMFPLLLIDAGAPTGFQLNAEAGIDMQVVFASQTFNGTNAIDGGPVGGGIGLFWAQCLNIRGPVTPRVCAGVDVSAMVLAGTGSVDFGPHLIASWFLSVGAGMH